MGGVNAGLAVGGGTVGFICGAQAGRDLGVDLGRIAAISTGNADAIPEEEFIYFYSVRTGLVGGISGGIGGATGGSAAGLAAGAIIDKIQK